MGAIYYVQGLYGDRRVREKRVERSSSLAYTFEGLKLDEIQLTATIKSKNDIANLINFLSESAPCFG